jgi:cytochrome c oxidase subunit 2
MMGATGFMSNKMSKQAGTGLMCLAAALAAPAQADSGWHLLNMPVGVSELSREIHGMHMLMLWICVAIAVVTFGAMIVALVRFRKSRGAVPDRTMLHSTGMEIAWTIIPVFILIGMAVPSVAKLIKIEDTSGSELTIKVTGYQWQWHYEYLDKGVSFYLLEVDHPLVVPTGTKIRILLTANDVIHAWWVPDFGMKRDAIPGFINEMWISVDPDKPGTYRGQCAELCGRDHGFMPVVVVAKPKAEFQAWLEQQQAAARQVAAPAAATVTATAG